MSPSRFRCRSLFLSVSHAALLAAVQPQPPPEVTVTEPVPPAAATDWLVGESANEQGAAACVTVNVCPPTVIVAVLALASMFAATRKLTFPLPFPVGVSTSATSRCCWRSTRTRPRSSRRTNRCRQRR